MPGPGGRQRLPRDDASHNRKTSSRRFRGARADTDPRENNEQGIPVDSGQGAAV
jgi:hypothetical protein